MRVVVGGFVHETNTYADRTTGPTYRSRFTELRGSALLERNFAAAHPGGSSIGGFISAASELGYTLVPSFWCGAGPSGTVSAAAFQALRDELLVGLAAAMPFDAVALDLHGAGVGARSAGAEDLEGAILTAVRSLVGPDTPIVAPLDLHGNITEEMVAAADFLVGNHLNPHTDCWERGHEAFSMLPSLLQAIERGSPRPAAFVEHLPMLIPPTTTDRGEVNGRDGSIAAEMNDEAWRLEQRPGVLDCTCYHGFFKSDTPDVGMHVLVTAAEGDRDLAQRTACDMAQWIWARRDRFKQANFSPTDAVQRALLVTQHKSSTAAAATGAAAPRDGPVVLHEISDNPGSGAPGDATHLLRAIVEGAKAAALPPHSCCFGMICDPSAAAAAHAAGVGAEVTLSLGGHHAPELCGEPLCLERARVLALSDGRYTLTAFTEGMEANVGPSALLDIEGVDVVVSSTASQILETSPFDLHGVDVRRYMLVGIKSAVHFRAGYRELASLILPVDAPGLSTCRTETFARERQARPLWGKDDRAAADNVEVIYTPSVAGVGGVGSRL